MRKLIIVVAALAVMSCGNPAPDNLTSTNEAVSASEASPVGAGENKVADAGTGGVDTSAAPAPAGTIPAVMQGRWGLVAADCTSTRGDAKGLLEISDKQLRFYESRGTLRGIVESGASRIVADFDFTGEGENWQRRMSLDIQDEGKTLIRREQGADAMPGALRYRTCEGA